MWGCEMLQEIDRRWRAPATVCRGLPAGGAKLGAIAVAGVGLLLSGCSSPPMRPDRTDLTAQSTLSATMRPKAPTADAVPDLVDSTPATPPRDTPHLDRYSVVVSDVDIRDLLFAVARDAKVNVDVDPRIQGHVSINAIEQTLPQILNRLARQVDLRYEFDGKTLLVQAGVPYLHQYPIDYVNMTRDAKSTTTVATLISAAGGSPLGGGGGQSSNNSTTEVRRSTPPTISGTRWSTASPPSSASRPCAAPARRLSKHPPERRSGGPPATKGPARVPFFV